MITRSNGMTKVYTTDKLMMGLMESYGLGLEVE